MRRLGWNVEGVEPDPVAVASARDAGLSVLEGTLSTIEYPANHFDAITMSHVIEHLHDPLAALRECYRILRPGGVLWVATPNLGSYGHKLFGRDWRGLEPPRHLGIFTRESLKAGLKETGFEVSGQPRVSYSTHYIFQASAAIARGTDPINSQPPLPRHLRLRALIAELRSWLLPSRAEEVMLLSRKPTT
jgi:predicted SAM-dependent methyltransferase